MPVSYTFPGSLPNPSGDDYSYEEQPQVRTVKFEDGYEQRSKTSLNARPRNFDVTWPNLTVAEKNTLVDFLRARDGTEAFYWTPPQEGSAIKVKAPRWSVRTKNGPWWTVRVRFEEVFDQ